MKNLIDTQKVINKRVVLLDTFTKENLLVEIGKILENINSNNFDLTKLPNYYSSEFNLKNKKAI